MIAVDTNLLVYAHRSDSDWHRPAAEVVRGLAEGSAAWAVPWPCVHEFLSIVTHPRIFDPPSPREVAMDQVEAWLESPSVTVIGEAPGYLDHLKDAVDTSRSVGPRVHDARIAALCTFHSVRELWTADRDFTRFPALIVRNPLVD